MCLLFTNEFAISFSVKFLYFLFLKFDNSDISSSPDLTESLSSGHILNDPLL